ncbi:MAG: rRNA pseudouridine synthase [Flavobacteriaceae bacterium]|nr:rRNA pseudouridine synthase [Flavobacteriaceae bacterium]
MTPKNSSRGRQDSKKTSFKSTKRFKPKFNKRQLATPKGTNQEKDPSEGIRLNKYISNAGICSRREADIYIAAGNAQVNEKIVTQMGYKVKPTDVVKFDGSVISPEKKRYLLLNKPKNYITSTDDERGRKTVLELIANACNERLYPVGRLDRNTTGLLLFTNDGDMIKRLTNPKNTIKKLYHVSLDKKLALADLQKLSDNFMFEGKRVFVDAISYIANESKSEIGIQIHSGRNKIIRKIFEHLRYRVVKLDRVVFADLTKKNLPRGRYRMLTAQEIINLKML